MFGFIKKALSIFNPKAEERRENAEELEELLLKADLGGSLSHEISNELIKLSKSEKVNKEEDMSAILFNLLSKYVQVYEEDKNDLQSIYLILGVNGSGKTTTCAKLANMYMKNGKTVLLSALDTFRAAAAEQLSIHARRIGARIMRKDNAGNPAAVIFDAIDSFKAHGEDYMIADTAGRMHTRDNLLKEIQKIDKIVQSKDIECNYRKFLVLDATTGQNAINQAENFDKAIGIDALILTKVDSGSRGGAVLRVSHTLNIPVAFICNGEKIDDIKKFDKDEYINLLLK